MINVLLNALQHPDTKVSTAAARSLGELRRPSPEVISALINILKSGKPGASGAAARSLGKLHQPTADVITALINALKRSKSLTVHKEVVSSLGELGYVSDDVIEALRACFDYQNPDGPLVREAAAKSLGKLGNASYKVISTLIEALSDKVPRVRIAAADTLGGLGESSSRVVKALIFTLRDGEEDQDVRRAAAENLERLSHLSTESEVLAELSKALRDTDPLVRLAAARSLSKLGLTDSSLTQQIERVLLNSLDHPQNWYRRRSVLLLGQFGQNDQTTIDKLLHGLLDADPTIRTACAQALAQLGWRFPNASEKIAKMLVQAINDPKFDKHDDLELRAHDYAYDALWMLIVGGVFEEV